MNDIQYYQTVLSEQEQKDERLSIPGFPDYEVTICGRIYSHISNKFLSPVLNNGYHCVTLSGSNGKPIAVHVLVAITFHGPRPLGYVVNHKNGIRTDNRSVNIEWVTQSENVRHAYKMGFRIIDDAHKKRVAALGRQRRSFTEEQRIDILASYTGIRGQIIALAKKHGLSRFAVSYIIHGMTK